MAGHFYDFSRYTAWERFNELILGINNPSLVEQAEERIRAGIAMSLNPRTPDNLGIRPTFHNASQFFETGMTCHRRGDIEGAREFLAKARDLFPRIA